MDETPEEMDQIRREADQIDVHQYKKRFRAMAAVGLGSLAAGAVWLVLIMVLFGLIHMIPVFGDIAWDGLLWPIMLIFGLVMAVTLVGLVGWAVMANQSSKSASKLTTPSVAVDDGTAFAVGTGPVVVDLYEDFLDALPGDAGVAGQHSQVVARREVGIERG